jgi:hypothetical protein
MDRSDDSYEGFMNFTMHYVMGGSNELDEIARVLRSSRPCRTGRMALSEIGMSNLK